MQQETDSFEDFEEAGFENNEEIPAEEVKPNVKAKGPRLVKNNLAAWRKIEDYWDNYKLNKQINDDPDRQNYSDYLLDGELN